VGNPQLSVLWCGLAIGLAFGAIGQVSGFCLYRGLRGRWLGEDDSKLRAFALALAIAIAGTQAADFAGVVDLRGSIYLANAFSWLLAPLGGVLFGWGMVLANGCGSRALVLLGQGNLRSFVVLLCLGIAAYMALTGVAAPLRTAVLGVTSVAPEAGAISEPVLRIAVALLLACALGAFALAGATPRRSPLDLAAGIVVGLLVVAGWLATGWLGHDEFEPVPPASLTFVAPVGESIQYLMIATGVKLRFGVAVVAGVIIGSLAMALLRGRFALEGFQSPRDMLRYMAGGALMGAGGALGMGCSIGQGLTGLSTLAGASLLAAAGILAGARLALRGTRPASLASKQV
jgi:uncharacterized membrane protein YedE/YeeE